MYLYREPFYDLTRSTDIVYRDPAGPAVLKHLEGVNLDREPRWWETQEGRRSFDRSARLWVLRASCVVAALSALYGAWGVYS